MDATVGLLIAYTVTLIVAGIVVTQLSTHHGMRQRDSIRRVNTESTVHGNTVDQLLDAHNKQVTGLLGLVERLVTVPEPPTPNQTSVTPDELYGQVDEELSQFHDNVTRDPLDTPDWTDSWLPDARGDEPRVASVRPGDSIVPGEGNWNEAMAEGRAVANGGIVTGEEQWEGEPYEG